MNNGFFEDLGGAFAVSCFMMGMISLPLLALLQIFNLWTILIAFVITLS